MAINNDNNSNNLVVVAAKRTPIAAFQGSYSNIAATNLGGIVIKNILNSLENNLDKNLVSEVIMGCVLPAGLGQAPARQASIYGGLDISTPCTTINKMCGSGLKAICQAADSIKVYPSKIIIAGGMENMTRSPYLVPDARAGIRLGHSKIIDHMFFDGLEDAYTTSSNNKLMGCFAEATAQKYNFSREAQDEYAILSANRARDSLENNKFSSEVAEVVYQYRNKEIKLESDEIPYKLNIEKIPNLKPAFDKNGTVTAANSSSIADGASAVMVMTQKRANELGLTPLARILDYSEHAHEPELFTTAPVHAIKKLYNKLAENYNLAENDIDLYEINEAFAVVTMAAMHDLNLSIDKVNVLGGACSLGHPIGASGARIVTTLINALKLNNKQFGVAALCIGGGEALAIGLELI